MKKKIIIILSIIFIIIIGIFLYKNIKKNKEQTRYDEIRVNVKKADE